MYEMLFADLYVAFQMANHYIQTWQYIMDNQEVSLYNVNYMDRKYHISSNYCNCTNDKRPFIRQPFQQTEHLYNLDWRSNRNCTTPKKCFVYKKEGYWSTNHLQTERDRIRCQYLQVYDTLNQETEDYNVYLLEYEGQSDYDKSDSDDDDNDNNKYVPII